ncbi:MAG: N-acetylglucosaminylphosphatidylinositol deacetylase [uncultured bacterium]|nr:MAG: N-acetylglucosaminylphosphatidylinositol deacetylase [uncultured bacterium]
MENWFTPSEPSLLPNARKVLVLAPHPDDEIFGCGGSLALFQLAGADIHVHVLTDGAGYATNEDRKHITSTRQTETNSALRILNLPPASFAEFADRSLPTTATLAEHILKTITRYKPDLVFAPSLSEIHPDHLATARAACAAAESLEQRGGTAPIILFYEIGAPQRPDLLVDITAVWSLKQQAMQSFSSQLAQQDYARHISALNTYRTYTLPASSQFAEAFSTLTSAQFRNKQPVSQSLENYLSNRWQQVALAAADTQAEIHQVAIIKYQHEVTKTYLALEIAQRETNQLIQETRTLQEQLKRAEAQKDALLHSRSWRITAPIRWLSDLLKHRS